MRRRSSPLTAPIVRIQLPSSTRERSDVHSAHMATLTVVALDQPRDQARLQRARELRAQVRRQPHQLDRERRHQGGVLAAELAGDLVHDVVDQLEEVDGALAIAARSCSTWLDVARRGLACTWRLDLHAARRAQAGRGLDDRGGPLRPSADAAVGGRKSQARRLTVLALGDGLSGRERLLELAGRSGAARVVPLRGRRGRCRPTWRARVGGCCARARPAGDRGGRSTTTDVQSV